MSAVSLRTTTLLRSTDTEYVTGPSDIISARPVTRVKRVKCDQLTCCWQETLSASGH